MCSTIAEPEPDTLSPGDCIISGNTFIEASQTSDGYMSFQSGKAMRHILSFLDVLEAAVLSNRLFFSTHGRIREGSVMDASHAYGTLGKVLIAEGVCANRYAGFSASDLDAEKARIAALFAENAVQAFQPGPGVGLREPNQLDLYHVTGHGVRANSLEIAFCSREGVRYLPHNKHFGDYVYAANTMASLYRPAILHLMDSVTAQARDEVGAFTQFLGFREVVLPPIVAVILDEAETLAQVPEVTLHYRDRFEPVRRRLMEYEAVIADVASPLSDRIAARRAFDSICEEVTRPYTSLDRVKISEWINVADLVQGLLAENPSPTAVARKLAKLPFDAFLRRIRMRSLHVLSDIRRKRFDIGSHGELIAKHFGTFFLSYGDSVPYARAIEDLERRLEI